MAPRLKIKGEYPADWKQISDRVKASVGWRCARCKHPHDYTSRRVLTVQHFDGDKSNCAPWNLMPLCQVCHPSFQGRVDPHTPLLTEPARWAMPYIAGFYEAGLGMPGPLYELGRWVNEHGAWPDWAPLPKDGADACSGD